MILIVSDGRNRPLKDKRGLVLRDTSTKRREEFNIALRDIPTGVSLRKMQIYLTTHL